MEWNPALEDRLKRSRQSAGWRWIGYVGVVLGLLAGLVGGNAWMGEKAACEAGAAPGEICQGPSIWVYLAPGILIFVLGIMTAVSADKAAKEARELRLQKVAASAIESASCAACHARLPTGCQFCPQCGNRA